MPSVSLDYIGSGNSYSGFDRFGRVVDQKWAGGSGNVDQFTYGYDRNSNRTYRENEVAESETTPVHLDELYVYDDLNRLTSANRGQLNNEDRITDHALSQTWELDATGNWKQFSSYDQSDADTVLVQQRTHNEVNEITDISETVGDQWVTPAHDRNGNMTTIPQPDAPTSSYTCIWDAWNRLVEVKDGASTVGQYSYDGLGRRIRKYVPGSPDSYQHFYYNAAWQLLETREASTAPVPATAQYQYVWSLRYIDAPVVRDDRAADPDEILYYLGDANFNVTTLIDTAGTAVERYVYDPYGKVTIYNADWSATRTTSEYNNSTLYTGRWRDIETGLGDFRTRCYLPSFGCFIGRDPIKYRGAVSNVYEYAGSQPTTRMDPFGLKWVDKWFGADAIGAHLFTYPLNFSPFAAAPLVSITVGGGIEVLFHCQTQELAEFVYVGIGVGIGVSMTGVFGFSINLGPFWLYNATAAKDFTMHFVNVTGSAGVFVGVYGEAFTDPVGWWSWFLGGAPPVWGFGFGVSIGIPHIGIAATYQYFWMVGNRIDKTLRRKYCCQQGGGAVGPNKNAARANIKAASKVDLSDLVAKGKKDFEATGQFDRIFADLPKGRMVGLPGPQETRLLKEVRKKYPKGPVLGTWYDGKPLIKGD